MLEFWTWNSLYPEVGRIWRTSPWPSHLNALHVLQEAEADRLQCLLRPLMKPVDSRAVHNGGELPAADPQLVPHRGEAESHLRSQKDGRTKKVSEKYSWRDRYILGFLVSQEMEKHIQQRQKTVIDSQLFKPRKWET